MRPLLLRIDSELSRANSPAKQVELIAQKACYLARIGRFTESNDLVRRLRDNYGGGSGLLVTVWIMLIEGLILYFERVSKEAHDRILRANALSIAGNIPDLAELTAAWLAHIEFARSQYSPMVSHLKQALSRSAVANSDAHTRAGIVLGDAYLHAGEVTKAQYWYESARQLSVRSGDEAAIGAIMYNRAAFGLNRLRIAPYIETKFALQADRLRFAKMEIESATGYHFGTATDSLTHLLKVCRAQALQLSGDYKAASELYEEVYNSNLRMEDFVDKSPLLLDLIWCLRQCSNIEKANSYLSRVSLDEIELLDPDDQVICLSRLLDVVQSGADGGSFIGIESRLAIARSKYLTDQTALLESLAGIATPA